MSKQSKLVLTGWILLCFFTATFAWQAADSSFKPVSLTELSMRSGLGTEKCVQMTSLCPDALPAACTYDAGLQLCVQCKTNGPYSRCVDYPDHPHYSCTDHLSYIARITEDRRHTCRRLGVR